MTHDYFILFDSGVWSSTVERWNRVLKTPHLGDFFFVVPTTSWGSGPSITSVSRSDRHWEQRHQPPLSDNTLSSQALTALIVGLTPVVYNYGQINYLGLTVLLRHHDANIHRLVPAQYPTLPECVFNLSS